jgi:geranylgeranyl diphosphate synthase type II
MTDATNPHLGNVLKSHQDAVKAALERLMPAANVAPERLHEAMRYAVLNGGKRVRASLVYMTGTALGADVKRLDVPACAVELIHAYSLVHDDLPSMDDDDLRRGVPTCHIAFDEATALLAGDALQTLAFELLANVPDPARAASMVGALARASGAAGMAGGQAIDLASVGQKIEYTALRNMHEMKTGALIRGAVRLGALAADDIDDATLTMLDQYGHRIGLAFQIQDDILDVEGDTATLGKRQGADQALDKPTYPALLGMSAARDLAAQMHEEALQALSGLDDGADPLRWLSAYIIERSH